MPVAASNASRRIRSTCSRSDASPSDRVAGSSSNARCQIARNGGGSRHRRSPVKVASDAAATAAASSPRPRRRNAATVAPWLYDHTVRSIRPRSMRSAIRPSGPRSVAMSQSMIRSANARSSGPSTSSASHAADAVLHALRVLRPSTQRIPPAGSSPVRTNPSTVAARSRCTVAPVVAANRRDASPSHASSSKYRRPARHDGAYPAPRRYRSRRSVSSAIGVLTPASAPSQAAHSTCTSVQSDAGRSLRRSSRTTRPRRVHRKAVRSSAVHTSDADGPSPTATLYGATRTSAELVGCASRALGVSR